MEIKPEEGILSCQEYHLPENGNLARTWHIEFWVFKTTPLSKMKIWPELGILSFE